jgi:hypothetical protein
MNPLFEGFVGTAFHQDARSYWFGGIGVLRCDRGVIPFVPEVPLVDAAPE